MASNDDISTNSGNCRQLAAMASNDSFTEADVFNGWTPEALAAYRQEREAVHSLVAHNTVTPFTRPRAPLRVEGCTKFNPHRW